MASAWLLLGAVATLALVVVAASFAAIAYSTLTRPSAGRSRAPIEEERLRAYREVMAATIALNRTAVELGGEQFYREADKLMMDEESALAAPYAAVNEAYQTYFHVLPPGVYDAVTEYVDYLAQYHDDGAQVSGLLSRAGEVGQAMRRDLDLEPVSGETTPTE